MTSTTTIGAINSRSNALSGGVVDSNLVRTPLPDQIGFQRGDEAPMVSMLGKEGPQKETNIASYWLWNSSTPITDTLTNTVDSSVTTWTVGHPEYYQVGAQITCGTERLNVTGRTATTITVDRAAQGSSAAAHTAADAIYIGSSAVAEMADDTNFPFTQGDKDYNVFQQVTAAWPMSHRAETVVTEEHPSGGWLTFQLKTFMERELPRRLEVSLFKNLRSAGTGTTASTFGGFDQLAYFTTRTSISGVLTETHINTALQTVFNLNADKRPKICVGSPLVGRILSSFYAGSRWITGDATSVTNYLDTFQTPFGQIMFKPNYLMSTLASQKLYFFDPADIKQQPYDSNSNWSTGFHETQGQHKRQWVAGDITYKFPYCDSRVELYGFSITEADYPALA